MKTSPPSWFQVTQHSTLSSTRIENRPKANFPALKSAPRCAAQCFSGSCSGTHLEKKVQEAAKKLVNPSEKDLRRRLLNAPVISTLLYGCEAVKLSGQVRRRLNSRVSKMLSRITGRTFRRRGPQNKRWTSTGVEEPGGGTDWATSSAGEQHRAIRKSTYELRQANSGLDLR